MAVLAAVQTTINPPRLEPEHLGKATMVVLLLAVRQIMAAVVVVVLQQPVVMGHQPLPETAVMELHLQFLEAL